MRRTVPAGPCRAYGNGAAVWAPPAPTAAPALAARNDRPSAPLFRPCAGCCMRCTRHDICRNAPCAANTSRCGVQMNRCPPAPSTLRLCSAEKKIRWFRRPGRQDLEVERRNTGTTSAPLALPTPCESLPVPLKTSAASPLPLLHCHAQGTKTPGLWRFLPAWRGAGLA